MSRSVEDHFVTIIEPFFLPHNFNVMYIILFFNIGCQLVRQRQGLLFDVLDSRPPL